MIANSKKAFVVIDLETTGLDVTKDRIIEIGLIKTNPDGSEERYRKLVNPEHPISPESMEITGITQEMVKDQPTFSELADEIAAFIGEADLGGYNSSKFDIPVLAEAFLRCDHSFSVGHRNHVDIQNIFHKMEQRTLSAAYKFYCGKEMENAHSAEYDAAVTLEVFKAQLERYSEIPTTIEGLAEFTRYGNNEIADFAGRLARTKDGKVAYNFGKHKGKSVEEIDKIEPGYYGWMLDADFPLYTKQVLKEEMNRIKESRKPKEDDGMSMEEKMKLLQNKFKK